MREWFKIHAPCVNLGYLGFRITPNLMFDFSFKPYFNFYFRYKWIVYRAASGRVFDETVGYWRHTFIMRRTHN